MNRRGFLSFLGVAPVAAVVPAPEVQAPALISEPARLALADGFMTRSQVIEELGIAPESVIVVARSDRRAT